MMFLFLGKMKMNNAEITFREKKSKKLYGIVQIIILQCHSVCFQMYFKHGYLNEYMNINRNI